MRTDGNSLLGLPVLTGSRDLDGAEPGGTDWAQRLLATAPLLLVTLTRAGTISFVNGAMERTLGYNAGELVGRCWCQLISGQGAKWEDLLRRLQAEDQHGCELLMVVKGAAPCLISWDFQRQLDAEGLVVALVGWGRDITAQRRDEQAREELIRQQQRALGARAELLAIAAHELKTPLTLLIGRSQLLQAHMRRAGCVTGQDQRDLERMVDTGLKLNAMVDTLFSILRLEEGQLQMARAPVDLHALLVNLLIRLGPLLQQHQVELSPRVQPAVVLGEPGLLDSLFEQLLENAAKYSPAGSLIRIDVQRSGLMARVQVRDQGQGIPPCALPGLFQPASEAAPAPYTGYRMKGGLYIVREVVTLHQGTLEVTSSPGQGTSFTIGLPLFRSEE